MSVKDTTESREYPVSILDCMIPVDCIAPDPGMLKVALLDDARKLMSDEAIRRGGQGDEPYASELRQLSCGRCYIAQCRHNTNPRCATPSSNPLVSLRNGLWDNRVDRGDQLVEKLKPEGLDSDRFEVVAFHMASRRNPRLFVYVKRRATAEELRLAIEVGTQEVRIGKDRYGLLPLSEIKELWAKAVKEFTANA